MELGKNVQQSGSGESLYIPKARKVQTGRTTNPGETRISYGKHLELVECDYKCPEVTEEDEQALIEVARSADRISSCGSNPDDYHATVLKLKKEQFAPSYFKAFDCSPILKRLRAREGYKSADTIASKIMYDNINDQACMAMYNVHKENKALQNLSNLDHSYLRIYPLDWRYNAMKKLTNRQDKWILLEYKRGILTIRKYDIPDVRNMTITASPRTPGCVVARKFSFFEIAFP